MTEDLKSLVSQADRGDQEAQRKLMKMGQEKLDAGEYREAAEFFRLAAMAYRIAASSQGSLASEAKSKLWWKEQVLAMYRNWVVRYAEPTSPRIKELGRRHMAHFASSSILQLSRDDDYRMLVRYLQEQLILHGVEISAPGNTINRHMYHMVGRDDPAWSYIHDIEVRIALDPIADEIIRRSDL